MINMNVSYPECSKTEPNQNQQTVLRLMNGDSFKITYQFTYESMGFQPINLNAFDFKVRFFTLGNENTYIEFTKPSISDGTCLVDPFRGMLTFMFYKYNLPNGNLYGKYLFKLPRVPGYDYPTIEEYTKFTGISLI